MIVNDPTTSLVFSVIRPVVGRPARTVDQSRSRRPRLPRRGRRALAAALAGAGLGSLILAR
jgi:hypothetical protein